MITKFKIFESVNELPELGDYVIVDEKVGFRNEVLINFYKTNIGEIIKKNANNWYDVKYENKLNMGSGLHIVEISGLKYWSHNKKELEDILINKKYNI